MVYTVGEMAKMLEVPASTLRYYDKEGLLPFVERSPGGMQMFQEKDFEWLQVIGCLKKAGMPLRDIRVYIELAMQGDDTIGERLALFEHQREVQREQMQQLDAAQIPERFRSVRGELRTRARRRQKQQGNRRRNRMNFICKNWKGTLLCLVIALPCWWLGKRFPIVGGPVFAIVCGMIVTLFIRDKSALQSGITFVSKKVLQYAVILLGFGMNLSVILQTGKQSLPIILVTITTSLVIAWVLHKLLHIPGKISTLIGVGSSICGGSAIAATAPVIDADDEEVAQAISVIFFFNMLAALLFPMLGTALGFSQTSGEAFGIFAGTAVNDTSSVTAAASTWDSMYSLGSETLDKAVTVKLTRTLAIIPITLVLAWMRTRSAQADGKKVELKKIFPFFILYFILASVITTAATALGVPASVFSPLKTLSKFLIVLAMSAIGLNTNIVKLIRTGGKPLGLGFCCWVGIAGMSLLMQHILGLW